MNVSIFIEIANFEKCNILLMSKSSIGVWSISMKKTLTHRNMKMSRNVHAMWLVNRVRPTKDQRTEQLDALTNNWHFFKSNFRRSLRIILKTRNFMKNISTKLQSSYLLLLLPVVHYTNVECKILKNAVGWWLRWGFQVVWCEKTETEENTLLNINIKSEV